MPFDDRTYARHLFFANRQNPSATLYTSSAGEIQLSKEKVHCLYCDWWNKTRLLFLNEKVWKINFAAYKHRIMILYKKKEKKKAKMIMKKTQKNDDCE